jgi:hypothetical protein
MSPPRSPRDRQRGNSLLLALIVMSSLATLGSLTVVSVQSSLKASTNDRSQTVAMYAAESGGAAAMEFLRDPAHFDLVNGWAAYVPQDGAPRTLLTAELPSNGALSGSPNNLFSPDMNSFFVVEIVNNRSDAHYLGFAPPLSDDDGIVIIRSTGHGPQGSLAVVEWEVQRIAPPGAKPWNATMLSKALTIRSWRTVL